MNQVVESIDETVGDRARTEPNSEVALNLSVVVYTLTGVVEGQPKYETNSSSYELKPGIANAVKIGFGEEYEINLGEPTGEQKNWLAEGVELEDGSADAKGTGGNQGYGSLVFCECEGLTYVPRNRKKVRRVSLQRNEQVTPITRFTQVQTEDALCIAPTKFDNIPLYAIHIAEVTQA